LHFLAIQPSDSAEKAVFDLASTSTWETLFYDVPIFSMDVDEANELQFLLNSPFAFF
jgi:hypothetical protein